ncbi:hypothetical protein [Priestia megaterium]|nr:hypothetical protein [Priestia megaterium]
MMICECGTSRVGNAKFCVECGNRFQLSDEEEFLLQQQKLIRNVHTSKEQFKEHIVSNLFESDHNPLMNQYTDYLTTVREYINYCEENADRIVQFILSAKDKNEAMERFLNDLKKGNSEFEYVLDEVVSMFSIAEHTKENFKPESFLNNCLETHKKMDKKYQQDYKRLADGYKDSKYISKLNQEEIDKCENAAKEFKNREMACIIMEELHQNEKLLPLIRYRYIYTGGKYPKTKDKGANHKSAATSIIEQDNQPYTNGVLDVLEIALAFTSPVSAARYIITKLKDK